MSAEPQTLQEAIIYFSDSTRCREYLVARRWPNGITCPTCGNQNVTFQGKHNRWQCATHHPKRTFTLKTGTVFEDSPLGLDKWLCAMWLVVNCKNGVSSYEVARAIGVTQKSAWFMLSRLRLVLQSRTGGKFSGHVEADETFIGGAARFMHKSKKDRVLHGRTGHSGKAAVFGLLERGKDGKASRVRTKVIGNVKRNTIQRELRDNIVTDGTTTLYTDALRSYDKNHRQWFPSRGEAPMVNDYMHKVIDHAERYVDGVVHTNGMENFWSLLKRTIKGTYVSVEPFHLFRYLDEQAFRFNEREGTDRTRFETAIKDIVGRRITFAELTGANLAPEPVN